MEATKELIKQVGELNELVRGATEGSDKAILELRGVVEGYDERLQATEQYRKDIDALSEDLRKFTKQVLARTFDGRRGNYRGNFADAEEARHFGLAILGHCCGMKSARDKLTEEGIEIKAMGEGTDVAGGFLAPEGPLGSIIRLVELYGVFRRNVLVVPMSRDRQPWPVRRGGLTVYCPGEGAAITASDVSIGQVALTAKKWCTLTAISSELEEDAAIAIAELIADEIAIAFAQKEDACGFVGDASSTYFGVMGVLNHGDTTNQACDSGDTTFANACKWKYLTGAIGLVPTWAMLRARYFFHRSVFWTNVVGQVDSSGQPIVKFITAGGEGRGAPLQLGGATPILIGFPVELVDSLPATSADAVSTACWSFGSLWRSWMLGQRRGVEVAQSREVYFASDQIGIRGAERIDIAPADASGMSKTTTAAS